MDGDAALDAIKARIRAIGGLAEATAREAEPLLRAAAQASAAAGTTPDGDTWAPKKTGGRALEGAAKAVSVSSAGATLTVTLEGPETWHQKGIRAHTPKRQVIPEPGDDLPAAYATAIEQGAQRAFAKLSGGA